MILIRKIIEQHNKMSITQIIGAILLAIGIAILIFLLFYSIFNSTASINESTVVSIGFFIIMLSMALLFPSLLMEPKNGSMSTMRLAIFMIVSVFVILCIKIGWTCASFTNFTIDKTWGYILGAALGSKAIQSLGENNIFGKSENSNNLPKRNISPYSSNTYFSRTNEEIPLHDSSTIDKPPSKKPPVHITKRKEKKI